MDALMDALMQFRYVRLSTISRMYNNKLINYNSRCADTTAKSKILWELFQSGLEIERKIQENFFRWKNNITFFQTQDNKSPIYFLNCVFQYLHFVFHLNKRSRRDSSDNAQINFIGKYRDLCLRSVDLCTPPMKPRWSICIYFMKGQ